MSAQKKATSRNDVRSTNLNQCGIDLKSERGRKKHEVSNLTLVASHPRMEHSP